MSIGRDDFLRGHFQFQVPLAKDFTIAGDVFHDFRATGGFKENIGVEVAWPNSSFRHRARRPDDRPWDL
jgi:hypothetical protein